MTIVRVGFRRPAAADPRTDDGIGIRVKLHLYFERNSRLYIETGSDDSRVGGTPSRQHSIARSGGTEARVGSIVTVARANVHPIDVNLNAQVSIGESE